MRYLSSYLIQRFKRGGNGSCQVPYTRTLSFTPILFFRQVTNQFRFKERGESTAKEWKELLGAIFAGKVL